MTKREIFLRALRNEKTDTTVWAPNLDYWLSVNRAENTLPMHYSGMSRNDIIRSIGGYIWNRVQGYKAEIDQSVKESWSESGNDEIHEYATPLGVIREIYSRTEGHHRSKALKEHFVKDLDTLRIMKYVVEATHYEPDYDQVLKALFETGEDGIVLHMSFSVPFIQFAKTDAGYLNGYYLWADNKEQVEDYLKSVYKSFIQGYSILADGPADVISTADNMDGAMISPQLFKEYAIPFYREVKSMMSAKGKIFEGHWCGRTQSLLELVPDCGLDVIEAIVTKPMADIELTEAICRLQGKVVLQGGIPAVLVCNEGATFKEFECYMKDVVLPLKGKKGFILGMSDNVPPNADFSRIEAIVDLI